MNNYKEKSDKELISLKTRYTVKAFYYKAKLENNKKIVREISEEQKRRIDKIEKELE